MKLVKAGEIFELAYGRALKQDARRGGKVPVIGSGGIVGWHDDALTKGPTIVVGRKGSIGSVTWVDGPGWPIDTAYFVRAVDGIDLRWLFWRLQAMGMPSMNKSAAVPGLNRDDVYRLEVAVPPISEQRRVATILDWVENLAALRREALARLDALVSSTFNSMFGAVPRSTPLSELAEVWDCPHSTPRWTTSGEICLRTPNLTRGGWDWNDKRFVDSDQFLSRSKGGIAQPGDIILSREGTVGIGALVEPGMRVCMGQRLVQVRVDKGRLVPEFALEFLLTALHPVRISQIMVGSTAKHLNVKDLRALAVPVPSLSEQEEFGRRLQILHEQRRARNRAVVASNELFTSIQSRAFRGEL